MNNYVEAAAKTGSSCILSGDHLGLHHRSASFFLNQTLHLKKYTKLLLVYTGVGGRASQEEGEGQRGGGESDMPVHNKPGNYILVPKKDVYFPTLSENDMYPPSCNTLVFLL
jgi:hypothetical protein